LWLSNNESPAGKTKIAYSLSWTGLREWTKYGTQKSVAIHLEAGKKYYIEALHKEGNGGDHLSVAWQLPDGAFEAPVAGSRLSPYVSTSANQCSATGVILREQWNNIDGNDVGQIPLVSLASAASNITSFEGPSDVSNKYGSRIRGYICVPQTGNYTFWIAGDDATELWLSSNALASAKKKIAYNLSWTGFREWNKFASQKSEPVYLEAGKKYYIEAVHKQGHGGDHLSVAWQLPDGTVEAPIGGERLSPVIVDILTDLGLSRVMAKPAIETEETKPVETASTLKVFPNPITHTSVVEISSPEAGQASVELYDISGRLVKTLFRGQLMQNDKRQLMLDGARLVNGVYFVRFRSGSKTEVMKVVKSR
ncbi:MAG TPA: PA14 domain-containing protein, partial [Flavisolibacter sp.]|nr:PA14 domain-containing protein [Flavisolibacter sp.]